LEKAPPTFWEMCSAHKGHDQGGRLSPKHLHN